MTQDTEVISCPACRHLLRVPRDWLGQPVQCPECQAMFKAPVRTADGLTDPVRISRPAASSERVPGKRLDPMLMLPAFGLMFVGFAGLVVGGLNTVRYLGDAAEARQDVLQLIENARRSGLIPAGANDPTERAKADQEQAERMAGPLRVMIPLFAVVSGMVFYGGLAIAIRRHYRMAQLGCVLAMLNIAYGCCFPGLVVGLWGLLMLRSPEARAHFGR